MSEHDNVLPILPYAGTSGFSGSETSEARAREDDTSGRTTIRQRAVLGLLEVLREEGMTWKDLSEVRDWHHGKASGTLSNLHKAGLIARLSEKRDRCKVYVLPEFVGDRETEPYGGKGPARTYSLAEIRNGTGWPEGVRFQIAKGGD